MLALPLIILFSCGLLSLCFSRRSKHFSKAINSIGMITALFTMVVCGIKIFLAPIKDEMWLMEFSVPWIEAWRINFHLAIDVFSFWLSMLALIMGLLALWIARPTHNVHSYYAAISLAVFGVIGLFLSADVFLFFIFWELALVPVYWIMVAHGNVERVSAALRFLVFTQVSALFLLVSILALVYSHYKTVGIVTFDYQELTAQTLPHNVALPILFGFLCAFLIKLPAFPFHTWMPPLFSEAPAAIILVAILVKTAVFGLVRFTWAMFPEATESIALFVMILGVISTIYGAVVAFSQTEPKRFLAYSTISHAGMLLVGAFCEGRPAYIGIFLLLITQALSTGGALMVIDRLFLDNKVNLSNLGGLWKNGPKISTVLFLFLLAGFGFPIFGNFVGEWSILWGVYFNEPAVCATLLLGVVLSAVYSLRFFQQLCLGHPREMLDLHFTHDLSTRELSVYGAVLVFLVAVGLYPSLILDPPFLRSEMSWSETFEPDWFLHNTKDESP